MQRQGHAETSITIINCGLRRLEWNGAPSYRNGCAVSLEYAHKVLEECCRSALELDKTTYTFIKNSIKSVSDELQEKKSVADRSEERNRGGFVMDPSAMDVDRLLSRTKDLKYRSGKEAD